MRNVVDNLFVLFGLHSSIRYLVVGGLNTLFSYGVYALGIACGLPIPWASLVSLLLGIAVSFFSQGKLVFKQLSRAAFVKFLLHWAAIYFFNLELILQLVRLGLDAYSAAAVATIPVTVISYFSLQYIVFRK